MEFVGNTWNSISFMSLPISTHLYRVPVHQKFHTPRFGKDIDGGIEVNSIWPQHSSRTARWTRWKYFSRGWSLMFRADISEKTASTSHLTAIFFELVHVWLFFDDTSLILLLARIYMQEAITNMHETLFRYFEVKCQVSRNVCGHYIARCLFKQIREVREIKNQSRECNIARQLPSWRR